MDTPKRGVQWLEAFPPDIWAYLVCYLTGRDIFCLLMTGARLVWQRLKAPKVVRSITLVIETLPNYSLPALLTYFPSLSGLTINHCSVQILCLKLDSIPSGLRKLEFLGYGFQLLGESGLPLDLSERFPYLETLKLPTVDVPESSWGQSQSLTSLCVSQWTGSTELPPCLIHFRAEVVTFSSSSVVSKLPPSLLSFVAHAFHDVDFHLLFPLLPPSLRKFSLDLNGKCSYRPLQTLLEELPKSLTSLELVAKAFDLDTHPEFALLLPSTLTSLKTWSSVPCTAWPLLPQSLKKLSFLVSFSEATFLKINTNPGVHYGTSSIPFETLPRSMTSICIMDDQYRYQFFSGLPTVSTQSYFPPHLTYLNLPCIQLSAETTKLLPPSITFMHIGNFCERVCQHLPTGLKTLKSDQVLMSPNLIRFLPRGLTHLSLSFHFESTTPECCEWYDSTGKKICLPKLAEYWAAEQCLGKLDWTGRCPPPPALTYFSLRGVSEISDSFLRLLRLPNLLVLDLGDCKNFTDNDIPLLSPHLTDLNLRKSHGITGKSFRFLPRCLTHLVLETSASVVDSDFQHLPRTLKKLESNSIIHLTEEGNPDLPPNLTVFRWGGY